MLIIFLRSVGRCSFMFCNGLYMYIYEDIDLWLQYLGLKDEEPVQPQTHPSSGQHKLLGLSFEPGAIRLHRATCNPLKVTRTSNLHCLYK